ncbi:MAG: hypothetical protein ACXACP_03690 [Candidatus Hodarchaeales archaeon]|jgi:hypothetical protein
MTTIKSLNDQADTPWTSALELQQQTRYKFGLLPLDALFPEGLVPGSLILLQGEIDRKLLHLLVTHLSIGLLTANDPFELAFIDGANLFPYYDISTEARKRGYNPLTVLERIQLARAFNFHQVTEIITKRLPALLTAKPDLRLVFVPQLSSQYLSDEALEYLEYARLSTAEGTLSELTQTVGTLKTLALQYDLIVIITSSSATHSQTKGHGGTFLAHSASSVIRMFHTSESNAKNYDIRFTLQKDPARATIQLTHSHRQTKPREDQLPLNRFW